MCVLKLGPPSVSSARIFAVRDNPRGPKKVGLLLFVTMELRSDIGKSLKGIFSAFNLFRGSPVQPHWFLMTTSEKS